MITEILKDTEIYESPDDPIEEDLTNKDKQDQTSIPKMEEINNSDLDPIKAFKAIQLHEKESKEL